MSYFYTYLGCTRHWLTQRATDDVLPHDLVARAEDILRTWQVVLPASSALEELIASVTARVQDEVYTRILTGLTPELLRAMDDLLDVPSGERHSLLFQLNEYPPEASPAVILRYVARYHFLRDLGVGAIDLRRVSLPMIRYFAEVTKRYDVRALRRFPPARRYVLTACFLVEVHKTILDHIVALHDQLLTQKMREAKHAFEQLYQQVRRQYRRGLATLIHTGETLLDPERPPETTLAALRQELGEATLQDAVATCLARQRLEDRGEIDALRARYPGLRRYLPAFFVLPFQGEPGSEPVLAGLDLVRQLDAGVLKTLPWGTPIAFVPRKFWPALSSPDGTLDRRTWEMGLAVAVRDGLRAGDVYLPESRRHVSFVHLVYDPTRWTHERDLAYTELHLPQAPDDFIARLQREFDLVAQHTARGLPGNAFATIRGNRVHLKRRDALEVPPRLKHLRQTIEGALPRVRIEDVLTQVDAWCHFTHAFRRPGEQPPRVPHFLTTLLATLIAHGTNLGLATMAHSVEDEITADRLQEMSHRTAPAHIVLTRLASSAPSDRLAKALTALGQALRTLYLLRLRYLHEEPLRARMQLQLNRGEGRHQLARHLFFANQGAFQTGDYEEIMNKATCLSLLSNAVLVWNTVHMMRIIQQLRTSGETMMEEELARISPMAFSHVIPNGTYFTRRTPPEPEGDHDGHGHFLDLEMGSDA